MQKMTKFLLYFLSIGVSAYAAFVYGVLPLGDSVSPDMKANFIANSTVLYTHVFASITALLLGPFQFSTKLRSLYQNIHRWMGRIYLAVGVLIGGLSGLYLSQYATGGIVAQTGFACLALLWLFTGLRAYISIRAGDIKQHRIWMLRNYALTFAAVTLRLYLPLSMVSGLEFTSAYVVIAWLCWVPNLVFIEWWRYSQLNRINS